ncbi:uncharacterized protein LOC111885333 [Lactuca sativa]|uniref:uncharacterized protein LOC111885333 n=1 Tax=Lactuca sativa TaxID=4236 RepID=UPI000CD7EDCA|nr:uncharacterized protein LOC111885333 [Lactuca sativa]
MHSLVQLVQNNEINVLYQSPVFNDIYLGKLHDVPFQANGVAYKHGYYLTGDIYPPLSVFVKSFTCHNDPKRKKFKEAQESARKDVERTFGVLKRRWQTKEERYADTTKIKFCQMSKEEPLPPLEFPHDDLFDDLDEDSDMFVESEDSDDESDAGENDEDDQDDDEDDEGNDEHDDSE